MAKSGRHEVELKKSDRKPQLSQGLIELAMDRQGHTDRSRFCEYAAKLSESQHDVKLKTTAESIANFWKPSVKQPTVKTAIAIIEALGLDPADVIIDQPRPAYIGPILVPPEYAGHEPAGWKHVLYPGDESDGRFRSEMKLVLSEQDRELSESLIAGEVPTTFYDVVSRLLFFSPPSAESKDLPLTQLEYNHFVSISMVIHCDFSGGRPDGLWGYTRKPSRESPLSNLQTQGVSCLWNSAFVMRMKGISSLMDHWLDTAKQDPEAATYDFLQRPYPWLLRLIDHKISLFGYSRDLTEPLGVITNDMRPLGKNRVYTQFVFHVQIALPSPDSEQAVNHLQKCGDYGRGLGHALPFEEKFAAEFSSDLNGKQRTNHMDLLAWRALQTNKDTLASGSSAFTRGFRLI